MIKKRIAWIAKRHPFLYYVRFLLLSKNLKNETSRDFSFNENNTDADIPKVFHEINARIELDPEAGEFEKALAIAAYLRKNTKVGPALSMSSKNTIQEMLNGPGGVCSDFSLVFCIICFINGIRVREWNCVDRLYNPKFGHTFNEIYSTKMQKWVAVDSHKGIYFTDENQYPMSATDLFLSRRNGDELRYRFISDFVPTRLERLEMIYSEATIPFLTGNYKNAANDYFLEKFKTWPSFAVQFLMIVLGKNHNFIFVMDNFRQRLMPWLFKK